MKTAGIFFSLFWVIIILYPEFLAYLIWGFFLFLWLNILIFSYKMNNISQVNMDERGSFIKIGKYKIYK